MLRSLFGPLFKRPIQIAVGEKIVRDGFVFTDVVGLGGDPGTIR